MASATDRVAHPAVLAAAAGIATAAAVSWGTGLHPAAWLTWLVPLPLFLAGRRLPARWTATAALVGYLVGSLGLGSYAVRLVGVPVPIAAAFLLVQAGIFTGLVTAFRALVRRGRPTSAVLGVAALAAAADFLESLVSPHGTFLSPAVTQVDVSWVAHVGVVTGDWGITALLYAVPAALVVLLPVSTVGRPDARRVARLAGPALVLLIGGALAVGGSVAIGQHGRPTMRVAGAVEPLAADDPPAYESSAGRAVLASMVSAVGTARADHADVLVLAEAAVMVDDDQARLVASAVRAAAGGALTVVAGVVHTYPDGTVRNEAVTVDRAGVAHTYWKRHPIPGVEAVTPGTEPLVVADGDRTWAVAICKDLDFPSLVRDYGGRGVDAVLVPAWDVGADGWLHSRMAVLHAMEAGLPIVRSSRDGLLTQADGAGHVVAERVSDSTHTTVLVSSVTLPGGHTPYVRWGDWFGWLCVAGALPVLWLAVRRRRSTGPMGGAADQRGERVDGRKPVGAAKAQLEPANTAGA